MFKVSQYPKTNCNILKLLAIILQVFLYFRSAPDFRCFVSGIAAKGGEDGPEDIMGGLKAVFTHLYWRQDSTKVRFMYSNIFTVCTLTS